MRYHIISLFPDIFTSYLEDSIIGRAIRDEKIEVYIYNPRDYTQDKWARVDNRPYGGGPGMVLEAESILHAVTAAKEQAEERSIQKKIKLKIKTIFFSPSGTLFSTEYAKEVRKKKYTDMIFICGRYEGIDARVQRILRAEEVSVGSYVLTGGELPAMVMIDCISRQIPEVLGNFDSREEERISAPEVYTRPEILAWNGKKYAVPKVLLSGNHKKIDEWKKEVSLKKKKA